MQTRLSIGEVAALAGLPASTLRYYERIGLLPSPPRASGQRRYAPEILPLLAVIQLAKDASFSLPEIKALLYGANGTPSERWRELAEHKLAEVNAILQRVQDMKQLLEEALESDALHYELDEAMRPLNPIDTTQRP